MYPKKNLSLSKQLLQKSEFRFFITGSRLDVIPHNQGPLQPTRGIQG